MKLINRTGTWVRSQPWGLMLSLKLGQNFRFGETGFGLHPPLLSLIPQSLTSWFGEQNCLWCFPSVTAAEGKQPGISEGCKQNRFRSSVASVGPWVLWGKTKVCGCAKSCGWDNKGTNKLHLHFRSWRPRREALERVMIGIGVVKTAGGPGTWRGRLHGCSSFEGQKALYLY